MSDRADEPPWEIYPSCVVAYHDGRKIRTTFGPDMYGLHRRIVEAVNATREPLNEKSHEPIKDSTMAATYERHDAPGHTHQNRSEDATISYNAPASPPHAAAEPEKPTTHASLNELARSLGLDGSDAEPVGRVVPWNDKTRLEALQYLAMFEDVNQSTLEWAVNTIKALRAASPAAPPPIAREPTGAMLRAACDEHANFADRAYYATIWRQMYDAALKSDGKE